MIGIISGEGKIGDDDNQNKISIGKSLTPQSLVSSSELSNALNISKKDLRQVCMKYPMRINPYYASLIKNKDDPIYKQCVPSVEEIHDDFGEEDPLNEEPEHQEKTGVPKLITHRYPNRVLFLISNQCAMYCRFCTRKRKVGDLGRQPKEKEISEALDYINSHPEINDVILSGGDPLMLSDSLLESRIKAIYKILSNRKNHIIRIGTRMPVVLPQRVTEELVNMLKKYHPLYINTHFNHPNEITHESRRACRMLADAGIPLGNQTVLLKGVNDNVETMKELMQGLVNMRVKPYYIYQCDPVKGANHFRTNVKKTLEIYKGLRGHISGLAVPTLVIDAPGGGGKVPILPEYLVEINDKEVVLKNYDGKLFRYPQIESKE
jgi:lysine 2,3-aminomutase